MAEIKPFKALRPLPEFAAVASSVPYDVVYTYEVKEFLDKNPNSFLRVTRAEAEFSEQEKPKAAEIFARAKANLEAFISEGIFVRDQDNALYLYRLTKDGHSQTGVVACCSIDEYETEKIKKHEKTRPDKVEDRTEHMLALNAQTGLIFLAFKNTDEVRQLIAKKINDEPIYNFLCVDGVEQTVWKIVDYAPWVKAFQEVPLLYIADGHHRAESSSLARGVKRKENPAHTGDEAYNFMLAGMFPSEDLKILAYNRVVKDLNENSEAEFLSKIRLAFSVKEATRKEPEQHGEFCMYLNGKWFQLNISEEIQNACDAVEQLDVSLLQENLLAPILGIEDPRTDERIGFVGGIRGTDELERLVDSGEATVAFSLFPTSMDELFAVSDLDRIMPPKSTWFDPKLRDGLLVNLT
ncbi:MAG: DUF1015 domain-containing protein [Pyrinomonadaceae bacterium]